VSFYAVLKRAIGIPDDPKPQPAMAQMTIISTQPVKRSSGSRSPRARV
jgi:hypothetical protein